ncbi:Nitrous oxide reductase accessory protein NosL [Halogranum amylolyticum]|uniref:Nitrous oxide reductase accessory protein NosL n=1 Tax=Halogranum amylolyticum TaxID=660520 RepID=A0A1H8V5I1_9EURY|nr:nitrous oxide reductase accessory protein NosL [Halogranum amylolyticum]SEP10730.1 Nitrous oxide reductase accessory protein NosL [Halogranum amylolyticum]
MAPRDRCPVGHYSRRQALLAGATVALSSVAGCLGNGENGDAEVPAAITLPDDATCDVCGMVISQHPGPTTEIFYAEQSPEGHDNPARFDSTWEAYQYDFERQNQGWEKTAFYVTDYSSVEYSLAEERGSTLISTHPQKEAFARVEDVTYVAGSAVEGAMGKDLIGFTDESDAKSFQSEYGGNLVTHDEVTPEVIAGLGKR